MAVDLIRAADGDFRHVVAADHGVKDGPYGAEDAGAEEQADAEGDEDSDVEAEGVEEEFVDGTVAWHEGFEDWCGGEG